MNLSEATYEEGAATFTLLTGTGGGGMLSVLNDSGKDLVMGLVAVDIATRATADSLTFDFGVTPTSGTTSADNIMDGQSCSAVGILTAGANPGTNGKTQQVWKNGTWITMSCSGNPAGLVGNVRLQTMRLM